MRKNLKRVALLSCVVLVFVFSISINAHSISDNTNYKFVCLEYGKVLNVYTSGSPASGDSVTLYTSSGGYTNSTQCWEFLQASEYSTNSPVIKKLVLYYNTSLVANYHQADTACTLYPWASPNEDFEDYLVYIMGYNNMPNQIYVPMVLRDVYLGNSDSYDGAPCKWYSTSYYYPEDVWTLLSPSA